MNLHIKQEAQKLFDEYPYRTELHAHTSPASPCSRISPKEMIRLMKEQHYDAVVITNHFFRDGSFMKSEDPSAAYLQDFYETKEEGEKQGIRVLLGAEYRFDENGNDYLVYGLDEDFIRGTISCFDMGIRDFYKKYHDESRLILQAHPFRNGMVRVEKEYLDGIEIMNMHPNHNSRVAMATKYAREQGFLVQIIGTDLHEVGHEGIAALRTRILPENEAKLVEILRSGDYIFEVGGCPMLPVL